LKAAVLYTSGVTVAFRPKNKKALIPPADALVSALKKGGLAPKTALVPETKDLSYVTEDVLLIIVGTKP
jgi:hypothetical protein